MAKTKSIVEQGEAILRIGRYRRFFPHKIFWPGDKVKYDLRDGFHGDWMFRVSLEPLSVSFNSPSDIYPEGLFDDSEGNLAKLDVVIRFEVEDSMRENFVELMTRPIYVPNKESMNLSKKEVIINTEKALYMRLSPWVYISIYVCSMGGISSFLGLERAIRADLNGKLDYVRVVEVSISSNEKKETKIS